MAFKVAVLHGRLTFGDLFQGHLTFDDRFQERLTFRALSQGSGAEVGLGRDRQGSVSVPASRGARVVSEAGSSGVEDRQDPNPDLNSDPGPSGVPRMVGSVPRTSREATSAPAGTDSGEAFPSVLHGSGEAFPSVLHGSPDRKSPDSATAHSAVTDALVKVAAGQDCAGRDTADTESTMNQSTNKNSTSTDSARQDSTDKEAGGFVGTGSAGAEGRDYADKDSTNKDNNDSTNKDSTNKDKNYSTNKDSTNKDSAEKETGSTAGGGAERLMTLSREEAKGLMTSSREEGARGLITSSREETADKFPDADVRIKVPLLSDTECLLFGFAKSAPPMNRQLNVLIRNSKQQVDELVGELTF